MVIKKPQIEVEPEEEEGYVPWEPLPNPNANVPKKKEEEKW